MYYIKKGKEWRFGMKCHIGVDAGSGNVHTITATAAKVLDIEEAYNLIREDDDVAYGDSGYVGIEKRDEIINDEYLSKVEYRIVRRPKSLPLISENAHAWDRMIEHHKSSIRCKVKHPFHYLKNFGF